jgi:crossover junction endodeoxyribonuclease RuvC
MNKLWLGIDPGIALIGWAVLEGDERENPQLIDYGTIQTDKQLSTPQRLGEIEKDMVALLREFAPDGVAIEMPYFGRQIKAAGGVMQAMGVINLVIYRERQLEPIFLHQSSWKCHLGNGRATKDEVAEILQQLFDLESLPIDDSLDAIGIAYAGFCGLRNQID